MQREIYPARDGLSLATYKAEVHMLNVVRLLLVVLLAVVTAGCELAGDIFQAGMWVGVILVVLAVGVVIWLVGKVRG